jgi:hypothetical protein
MELFLVDGFDLFQDGFADRPEKMRQAWLTHKNHLMQRATRDHGPGYKPWAYFAFELGKIELFEEQVSAVPGASAAGNASE